MQRNSPLAAMLFITAMTFALSLFDSLNHVASAKNPDSGAYLPPTELQRGAADSRKVDNTKTPRVQEEAKKKSTPAATLPPKKKPDEEPPSSQQPQQQGAPDYTEDFEKTNEGKFFQGVGKCFCTGIDSLKETAVPQTLAYLRKNEACITAGSSTKSDYVAINDYRSNTGCMYIIDKVSGGCFKAFNAAYGVGGRDGSQAPTPSCESGSLATPSGFHVTAEHDGARYGKTDSLLMRDLQGQGSASRGILIHAGKCNGGACTWGCTGVSGNGNSDLTFLEVKEHLPPGSLVYNYFGEGKECPGIVKDSCHNGSGSTGSVSKAGISGGGSSGGPAKQ
jgi:hypothetical protein